MGIEFREGSLLISPKNSQLARKGISKQNTTEISIMFSVTLYGKLG